MIYNAYELQAKFKFLQLWGQDEDGELEWVGHEQNWRKAEKIISDYENK